MKQRWEVVALRRGQVVINENFGNFDWWGHLRLRVTLDTSLFYFPHHRSHITPNPTALAFHLLQIEMLFISFCVTSFEEWDVAPTLKRDSTSWFTWYWPLDPWIPSLPCFSFVILSFITGQSYRSPTLTHPNPSSHYFNTKSHSSSLFRMCTLLLLTI